MGVGNTTGESKPSSDIFLVGRKFSTLLVCGKGMLQSLGTFVLGKAGALGLSGGGGHLILGTETPMGA